MDEGYQSGGTPGGPWGCGFALLIGLPLLGFALLVSALGDCAPDTPCNHNLNWLLIVGALGTAAIVGFASRAVINAVARRRRSGS